MTIRPTTIRPRVLHVRTVTDTGGGPDKTILRSPRYADCDMAVAYIHPRNDRGIDLLRLEATNQHCPFFTIPENGALDFSTVRRLLGICRERNITIWHGHDYKSNILGRILRRLHPMKLVATVHGFITETSREKLYHQAENLVLTGYDRVIAVSPSLVEHCAGLGVHPDRISYVPNGLEIEQYEPRKSRRNVRPIVGIVSRLGPEKGIDRAIRAIAQLPEMELQIVGDGPERGTLVKFAANTGVADRVTFHGWQTDPRPYLECFDALLLPSHTEGLPNVLLEAMALGVPVAATAVGGVPHLLDHGRCGILLPEDERSWIGLIAGLMCRDDSMIVAARQRIESEFTFSQRMRRVMAIYGRLFDTRSQPLAA